MANKLARAGVPGRARGRLRPRLCAAAAVTAGSPKVVNFWIAGSAARQPVQGLGGFNGSITNIDIKSFAPGVDHVAIDKDSRIQQRAVSLVLATVGK